MASKLVIALDIKTRNEFKVLTVGFTFESKKAVNQVLFHGRTYEEAGYMYNMTKQAVYDVLKRIYKLKYGVEYGKNESQLEDD